MKKSLLILIVLSGVFLPNVYADEISLREGHPDRYVVKKGDTLWDISSMFLDDPWLWPEIWKINPEVENPHLIFPGDIILLSYRGGRPIVQVVRPGEGPPVLDPVELEKPRPLPDRPRRDRGKIISSGTNRVVPRIRVSPVESAIPILPLDAIAGLLVKGRIVERSQLEDAPYVLSGIDSNLIFGPGDFFYARGDRDVWRSDAKVWGVYKHGELFRDPESGKILGVEAREAGLARLTKSVDDVATFDLISVSEDVQLNDRLLPTEERRLDSTFFPTAPNVVIRGAIMKILGGVGMSKIGMYDAIAINRGAEDGIEVGNVLEVFRRGKRVDDPNRFGGVRLPTERSGLVMVFRVFEKMSFALVLQATIPLSLGDPALSP